MVFYDTFNHKHMKQLLVLVHYFQAYDLENPLKNKLLTFVEISGETADTIFVKVMKAIANYDLDMQVVELPSESTVT
jgi:hypothetical protein